MRGVQLALLLLSIHVAGSILSSTGLFTGIYYEGEMIEEIKGRPISDPEAFNTFEQAKTAIDIFNIVGRLFTWQWIIQYFQPWYGQVEAVRLTVNSLVTGLTVVSWIVWGAVFIQFVRNLVKPL